MKRTTVNGLIGGGLGAILSLVVVVSLVIGFARGIPMGIGIGVVMLTTPVFSAFVTWSIWYGYNKFNLNGKKVQVAALILLAITGTLISIYVINVFIWYGIETMPCGWGQMDEAEYERCRANQSTFWEFIRRFDQSQLDVGWLMIWAAFCSPISFITVFIGAKRRVRKGKRIEKNVE